MPPISLAAVVRGVRKRQRGPSMNESKAKANPKSAASKAGEMLRFDLDDETETIRNYEQRVRQCEQNREFAIAEQIRQILAQKQNR